MSRSFVFLSVTHFRSDTVDTGPGNTGSRSRAWFFTWNNPGDTGDTVLESLGATKYCWQLEEGASGTPHIQGVLYFSNARSFSSLHRSIPEAHWEVARSIKACVEYCSKIKTRIGPTKIKGFEVPEEVLVMGLEDMEAWQNMIIEIIETEPEKRTIHWFWDSGGGIGKTELCKYLVVTYAPDILYVNGKATDMKYCISQFVENHKRGPKALLCDFPRTYEQFVSYQGLEEIKNGIFFSGKYESGMCLYNTPHVICFANFPPRLPALSGDRWNVVSLDDLLAEDESS